MVSPQDSHPGGDRAAAGHPDHDTHTEMFQMPTSSPLGTYVSSSGPSRVPWEESGGAHACSFNSELTSRLSRAPQCCPADMARDARTHSHVHTDSWMHTHTCEHTYRLTQRHANMQRHIPACMRARARTHTHTMPTIDTDLLANTLGSFMSLTPLGDPFLER